MRLMRWSDSSASGRTVTLKLPDGDGEHPFKGYAVGSKNGQPMEMEIWITEEGELEPAKPAKKPVPNKPAAKRKTRRGKAVMSNFKTRILPQVPVAPSKTALTSSTSLPPASAAPVEPIPPVRASPPAASSGTPAAPPQPAGPSASTPEIGDGLASYADRMGVAAEALAAVADRIAGDEDEDMPTEPTQPPDPSEIGVRTVRRAVDLCKSVDQQRAGFFYFMRTLYPNVPSLDGESDGWSRDSKATRDRVCFHCEMNALDHLADDEQARSLFEALENDFEKSERYR